ncbi:MAG: adenine deaminase C-terminal domain-containing protein, partial [Candidatus Bathyarchaeia archaeon]
EFEAKMVLIDGKIVAKDGEYMGGISGPVPKESVKGTVNVKELQPRDLSITCSRGGRDKGQVMARVIGIIMDQIVTEELRCQMEKDRDEVKPDPERDILKICVVERHRGTGRIGKGFVKGFGLREGAISSTVAHDSHNVIAVGTDDGDICKAVNRLREANGGFVIVSGNRVLDELPLPVAGLMTTLDAKDVAEKSEGLKEVTARLGSKLRDPFMTLSFLALPVIPKLKITDYGLVDVEKFEVVDLFIN